MENSKRHEERRKKIVEQPVDRRKNRGNRAVFERRSNPDRRTSMRFPILRDFVKPVEFNVFPSEIKETQPGIITHLSANGMALLCFAPVSEGANLFLNINLPGIENAQIEGVVVRIQEKGEIYLAGIKFNKVEHKVKTKLNIIANDFNDCELKLSFGIQDVCSKNCSYYQLCDKPQKLGNSK